MPAGERPAAEADITAELVRRLLADQHADLADRPLVEVDSGWDNVMFRLGDDLIVRMPRRSLSAPLVHHEQRWLPELATRLPVPVPVPVRVGRPALGYPWSWSVCPWIDGEPAEGAPFDAGALAVELGAFLRALHRPAPPEAPVNPYRGGPLSERVEVTRQRAMAMADLIDVAAVLACWTDLVATPRWTGPPVWLHGDMHPGNVLVRDGHLAGVVDFGDMTGGDPATDLSIAWRLLGPADRAVLRVAAGDIDDNTWARARGWALTLALAALTGASGNPGIVSQCVRSIDEVLTDESPHVI
jgi:aminoglycoside phosphotransferase (APT) family kinase protein